MSENKSSLLDYTSYPAEDNGELTNLSPIILEIENFISQFSTHAMSDYSTSRLQGKLDAYQDCLKYLKTISPYDYD